MRRALKFLYRASEVTAAVFVFAIFVIILLQVCFGLLDRVTGILGGATLGLMVPAYAELSAYLLAGAMFLALAGTLENRVHVRVSLLLQALRPMWRTVVEVFCGLLGAAACGYFAWRACRLAYESWLYGDLSYGMIVIPMWLPQLPMAVGLIVLTVAFLDQAVLGSSGRHRVEQDDYLASARGE